MSTAQPILEHHELLKLATDLYASVAFGTQLQPGQEGTSPSIEVAHDPEAANTLLEERDLSRAAQFLSGIALEIDLIEDGSPTKSIAAHTRIQQARIQEYAGKEVLDYDNPTGFLYQIRFGQEQIR